MSESTTSEDRDAPLVDARALERFVRANVAGAHGPVSVQKHEAGMSNETFYVTCGDQEWVLRRPPRGELLPTSHDVLREWRMIKALHGTAARVPRPVAACDDPSVIGAPFYLMERVDGYVIREELPPELDEPVERRRIADELITGLAEIHSVDWRAVGLETLGRPTGYLERQVKRWSTQLELTRVKTRALPGIDEVTEWLRAHVPESGPTTIAHGDYKLDNVIFSSTAPARLLAVLDWEMATLGDPLADLGWVLAYWGDPGGEESKYVHGNNLLTTRGGFPERGEMIALYEAKTGRSMREIKFYLVLAVYKLTIILEGLYALYLEGRAANQRAAEFEQRVPLVIDRAHRLIAEPI